MWEVWAQTGHAAVRQARFDMVDGQHSRFAMLDRRHGAEDVVGALDRRNHYGDYKPAVHSDLPSRLKQGPHRPPEASV